MPQMHTIYFTNKYNGQLQTNYDVIHRIMSRQLKTVTMQLKIVTHMQWSGRWW